MARQTPRHIRLILWLTAATVLAGVLSVVVYVGCDCEPSRLRLPPCQRFFSREQVLLRFVPDRNGERHLTGTLSDFPEQLQQAFLAAEDERFYLHPGFDLPAILRALKSNLSTGRIVSGGSTITQQLVRTFYRRPQRGYWQKLVEVVRAFRLERQWTKQQILEAYLNSVPQGNNLRGVRLASQTYFDREPTDLNLAECAVLAALPQAPSRLNPVSGDTEKLLDRRNWVLDRMAMLGYCSSKEAAAAKDWPLCCKATAWPFRAPHVVDHLLQTGKPSSDRNDYRTALDWEIQQQVEAVLLSHRERLRYAGARQAAVVVLDNREAEVLALAGSIEYGPRNAGFNNGALAPRSAGSTLKPFLYALGIDTHDIHGAEIIEDLERSYVTPFGDYQPLNYDRRAYGPISARQALGNSLNLSAVRVLHRVGATRFHHLLSDLGLVNYPHLTAEHYGLGLAIGNLEVSLLQLANAYAALARGGEWRSLHWLAKEDVDTEGCQAISPAAAFIVTDILSDPGARVLTFGGSHHLRFPWPLAWKTGTSTEYRDDWIVAYTPAKTIGVWVGNFEGDPTWGLSGSRGAGPILADIVNHLYRHASPERWISPPGVVQARVCTHSGQCPGPHCPATDLEWFLTDALPTEECLYHRNSGLHHELPGPFAGWVSDRETAGVDGAHTMARPEGEHTSRRPAGLTILSPLPGDHFVRRSGGPLEGIPLEVMCQDAAAEVIWYVDGMEYDRCASPYRTNWILEPGQHEIVALTGYGDGDRVCITVE